MAITRTLTSHTLSLTVLLTCLLSGSVACGGGRSAEQRTQTLAELRAAVKQPLESRERAHQHSRLVESVVEDGLLSGMQREEVRSALGTGEYCGNRPLCSDKGFKTNDWVYEVGQPAGPVKQPPVLIVGFDDFGHVDRVYNLLLH